MKKKHMQTHLFISGFVQGVGFRHFLRLRAKEFCLTGWARNLPDGQVEAVFQGLDENIEKIIKECKKGSFISEVEEVRVERESAVDKFTEFMII